MSPSPEVKTGEYGECLHCGGHGLPGGNCPECSGGKLSQVEDRWPVLYVERPLGGPQVKTFKHPEALLKGREHQTYYPADHPAVLTPDEARLLVEARDAAAMDVLDPGFLACAELCNRLSSWAEGEERDAF